jgi:hypothetical protein
MCGTVMRGADALPGSKAGRDQSESLVVISRMRAATARGNLGKIPGGKILQGDFWEYAGRPTHFIG